MAADDRVAEMESGQELKLELTDLNSSSVSTDLPLNQFAAARNAPAQTYDFELDED